MFSPTVRLFLLHDPRLRTETFSFSDFFKEPLRTFGWALFSGDRYFEGSIGREKINVAIGEPLFSEGPLLSEFHDNC